MPSFASLPAVALSGLEASRQTLAAAAHNIANAHTPGFRRLEVERASAPAGGVTVTLSQQREEGNDLVADVVTTIEARVEFEAGIAVLKAHDRTVGALLDAVA
ncbi:MAG: flagellar basal body rod protein [Rubrivivax sp.]|nr:flagellar basal body rod protein [Rubrivivax sp.]